MNILFSSEGFIICFLFLKFDCINYDVVSYSAAGLFRHISLSGTSLVLGLVPSLRRSKKIF